jgi:hypothetical protein
MPTLILHTRLAFQSGPRAAYLALMTCSALLSLAACSEQQSFVPVQTRETDVFTVRPSALPDGVDLPRRENRKAKALAKFAPLEAAASTISRNSLIAQRVGGASVSKGMDVPSKANSPLMSSRQPGRFYAVVSRSSFAGVNLPRKALRSRRKIDHPYAAKGAPLRVTTRLGHEPGRGESPGAAASQGPASVMERESQTARNTSPTRIYERVRMDESVVIENACLVPQQGVTRDPEGNLHALVVDVNGKVAIRRLLTTGTYGSSWVVEDGLFSGDRVIVRGADKVRPGMVLGTSEALLPAQRS